MFGLDLTNMNCQPLEVTGRGSEIQLRVAMFMQAMRPNGFINFKSSFDHHFLKLHLNTYYGSTAIRAISVRF